MTNKQKPTVIGSECRFVVHIPKNDKLGTEDTHLIKEQVHLSDGTIRPNVKLVRNFPRTFSITAPHARNHYQKKEWEHQDNLITIQCTESDLRSSVARALEKSWSKDSLRELCASPYIYGTEISSSAIIKGLELKKYPNIVRSPYTVASLDIETDVVRGTEDPVLITVCFKDQVKTFGTKMYFEGMIDPIAEYHRLAQHYLGEYTKPFPVDPTSPDGVIYPFGFNFSLEILDTPVDILKAAIDQLHKWMPDFVAIWNINFDIPKMNNTFLKYGMDLSDMWCDKRIPVRICRYKEGQTKKVTSSGKVKPINPAMQWHTFYLSATFYLICQMSTYRYTRIAKPEEASYKLGDTLDRNLNRNKLDFEEAKGYTELRWHAFMQTKYRMMYVIYNNWDAMSQLVLDFKTKDLSMAIGLNSFVTDFSRFNSQPRKIADAFQDYCDPLKYVVASVGPVTQVAEADTATDDDFEDDESENFSSKNPYLDDNFEETLGLAGWILTLKSTHQILGLKLVVDCPNLQTGFRAYVFDSDAVGAYPTATEVMNVSKDTNICELIGIDDIQLDVFKMQNMNLLCGPVNSIEYCTNIFRMPKPEELLNYI